MDVERIGEFLYYDPDSPSGLSWSKCILVGKMFNRKITVPGQHAGTLNNKNHYWQVRFERKTYRAHRVVLALHGIDIPEGMVVDHIDGNKSNNLIENLRVVTLEGNAKNKVHTSSNTNVPYIHYSTKLRRYQVNIVTYGKRTCTLFYGEEGSDAFDEAMEFLLSQERIMLESGYTNRQIENIKKGINAIRR